MNLDPLSGSVLLAGACIALASILTVLYDAIKNKKMKSGSRTLSVKALKGQDFFEVKEIKQEDGSLVIKVSLKKPDSDNFVANETKVANT
ncbi:hypothetical protein PN36_20605 [Candidatus Thiomargarita nelsonii]|uniref:Uncharacterized protein n=1 Tax=Candidatus Thiomargarita nelsonii TaxID=1003181 RepID=A0A0A6S089_9GAMM|nr:hypothetical protein PN36_20605 [Candidatus Thiomargarita nelsonii]